MRKSDRTQPHRAPLMDKYTVYTPTSTGRESRKNEREKKKTEREKWMRERE